MRTSFIPLAVILIVSVGSVTLVQSQTGEPNRNQVYLRDILNDRIALIGLLERPIGEILELQGRWVQPELRGKDDHPEFVVSTVNGALLKHPVAFDKHFVRAERARGTEGPPMAGDVWQMVAYESVQLRADQRLNEALRRPLSQDPFEGLRSCLVGTVTKATRYHK